MYVTNKTFSFLCCFTHFCTGIIVNGGPGDTSPNDLSVISRRWIKTKKVEGCCGHINQHREKKRQKADLTRSHPTCPSSGRAVQDAASQLELEQRWFLCGFFWQSIQCGLLFRAAFVLKLLQHARVDVQTALTRRLQWTFCLKRRCRCHRSKSNWNSRPCGWSHMSRMDTLGSPPPQCFSSLFVTPATMGHYCLGSGWKSRRLTCVR